LVLPTFAGTLPSDLLEAAMGLLGQAYSVATAPEGALPAEVARIPRDTVTQMATSLSEAGLRIQLGEPVLRSVEELLVDLTGSTLADAAFDRDGGRWCGNNMSSMPLRVATRRPAVLVPARGPSSGLSRRHGGRVPRFDHLGGESRYLDRSHAQVDRVSPSCLSINVPKYWYVALTRATTSLAILSTSEHISPAT
jgi:hypothetical protein